MTDTPSGTAEQVVEEFTARLDSLPGLAPAEEGWLAEEFSSLALSLGAD
jgi:hypothetical protein